MKAGAAYFAIVFALGFVLGTARILLLEPAVGEYAATAIEVPVMLAASWIACGRILAWFEVPAGHLHRGLMGPIAFVLLMAGELGVSILLLDRSFSEHWAGYREALKQIGLAAQLIFAAMPMLRGQAIPSASSA